MWRYWLPVVLLIGFMAVFWAGLHSNPSRVPSPLIGQPAPALSLPSLKDPNATLSDNIFKGHISLLNVWATWCVQCRVEYPVLLRFARQHDVPVYGLDYKDDRAKALAMLKKSGNAYTKIAFDKTGDVAINWGVYGAPETYLIDAKGIIRHKYIGPLTPAQVENDLLVRIAQLRSEP